MLPSCFMKSHWLTVTFWSSGYLQQWDCVWLRCQRSNVHLDVVNTLIWTMCLLCSPQTPHNVKNRNYLSQTKGSFSVLTLVPLLLHPHVRHLRWSLLSCVFSACCQFRADSSALLVLMNRDAFDFIFLTYLRTHFGLSNPLHTQ